MTILFELLFQKLLFIDIFQKYDAEGYPVEDEEYDEYLNEEEELDDLYDDLEIDEIENL